MRARRKSPLDFFASILLLTGAAAGILCAQPKPPASARSASQESASSPASQQESHANRLIHEKSPYLLLHAHNPVDWYPWGAEAFERARREQKPIFLSIGYYTCHWCHVMERESYSNSAIAAVLNQYFVAIKVDREERPDVDRLYIAYVESATGSAGWPLNVVLTPDRKPFFGGTYFPPAQLQVLLEKIADAWAHDRDAVLKAANMAGQELIQIVSEPLAAPAFAGNNPAVQPATLDKALAQIAATYDPANGGFGPAPKFPRPAALVFLLRTYARTRERRPLDMTLATLRAMARGGIHDQIGGGFHRYSTDALWRVPHFEKMLYDQAQLAVIYTEAHQATRDAFFQGIARDILDFSLREMKQPGGGFASALDADSPLEAGKPETAEGAYYVWTESEIESALGKEQASIFNYAYGVKPGGNVPPQQSSRGELAGKNVLVLEHDTQKTAAHFGRDAVSVGKELLRDRNELRQARSRRPRPPLDDKIVTAWNGMMVSALARAGAAFSEPRYLEAAQSIARFLEEHLYDAKSGRLWRSYRAGGATVGAFLDDYTDLIAGLMDLYEADFNVHWLEWAAALQEKQDQLFWDAAAGGYFDATASDPALLARTRESFDGAEPSPNSTAAFNLLRLSQITGRADWREKAEKTLAAFGARLASNPEAVPALASALDYSLAQKRQILIAGTPGAADTLELLRIVNKRYLPNKILLLADGGAGQAQLVRWLPFVAGARPLQGHATAYICENYICKLPTSDPATAARLLDSR